MPRWQGCSGHADWTQYSNKEAANSSAGAKPRLSQHRPQHLRPLSHAINHSVAHSLPIPPFLHSSPSLCHVHRVPIEWAMVSTRERKGDREEGKVAHSCPSTWINHRTLTHRIRRSSSSSSSANWSDQLKPAPPCPTVQQHSEWLPACLPSTREESLLVESQHMANRIINYVQIWNVDEEGG